MDIFVCRYQRRSEAAVAERAERRRPKHADNSEAGREEGGEEARERAEEGGDRRGSEEAGRVDEPSLPSAVPSSCRLELRRARASRSRGQ
uniref:Uncharacterized protein n=1 Tax=Oryza meridionalis TaxID=40149 RepID=A0A0E0D679_9ORYZ